MSTQTGPAGKSIVIMCVEDNHDTLEYIRLALRPTGYGLVAVGNPHEGLQLARRNPPDVVLLDLMMPDMNGWELLRQLRTDERTKAVPVVIMTARAGPVDRHYGEQVVKVDAYLTKPFEPRVLREVLQQILQKTGKIGPRPEEAGGET